MRALVLDGSSVGEEASSIARQVIEGELGSAGWAVETVVLRDVVIADCLGCFRCWVETPGVCVIDDGGRELVARVLQSDLLVFLTPVTFGGYSSELKKAIDRLNPLLSPGLTRLAVETHQRPRYAREPSLLAIGVLPRADEPSAALFRSLVGRNALDFHCPAHVAGVVLGTQSPGDLRGSVRVLMAGVGVKLEQLPACAAAGR